MTVKELEILRAAFTDQAIRLIGNDKTYPDKPYLNFLLRGHIMSDISDAMDSAIQQLKSGEDQK